MTGDLDRRIVRGTAWVALSYGGGQILSFAVLAVLANLLTPADFGLVSLASIVVVVMTYLQESGLGMAVIRQRDDLDRAAATMFSYMVTGSVVLYLATFVSAPLLARWFDQPDLTAVMRVLAILLVIRAIGSTAGALLERDLAFRSRAKGELTGAVVQAAVAIPLAFAGLGVWSLVAGQLASATASTSIFWILAPFRPNPRLASWSQLRSLVGYGRHITIGNVLGLVNSTVDSAVIGKLLGTTALGYYAVAWRVANVPALGVGYIVGRVMFPAYATIRDDLPAFRRVFVMNVQRVALASLPLALGMLICADPIIIGLLGEQWRPAVAPLRILAVFGLVRSFAGTSGAVFQAAGRPQLVYQLGLWHSAVLYSGLFALTPPFGVEGVAGAMAIAACCSFVPAWAFALRILQLSLRELLSAATRPLACALITAGVLVVISGATRSLDPSTQLVLLVVGGLAAYGITLMTIGRTELRSITTAFRSRSVTET